MKPYIVRLCFLTHTGEEARPIARSHGGQSRVLCKNRDVESIRKIGILGAGFISDFHIRALDGISDIALAAVCDTDRHKAEHLARKWSIRQSFSSLDEMLSAGVVNTIHVLVPPTYHADAALRCLEKGCDVFIEKPMTVTLDQARDVQRAAARVRRAVGVNHNFTRNPAFVELVRAVREWRLGEVQHVTACWNVPLRQLDTGQHTLWMFHEPGNIIIEQGAHPLSLVCHLLGRITDVSVVVTGKSTLNSGRPFYNTWQCSLVCERGTAQLYLSFGREWFEFWVHAGGQDGSAVADIARNRFSITEKSRFMEPVDQFLDAARTSRRLLGQGARNLIDYTRGFLKLAPPQDAYSIGMRSSIEQFYEDLLAGRTPREGVDQGVNVMEACAAIAENRMEPRQLSHAREAVERG